MKATLTNSVILMVGNTSESAECCVTTEDYSALKTVLSNPANDVLALNAKFHIGFRLGQGLFSPVTSS